LEKALELNPTLTQASWNVLGRYGNMSSATFLFVLKELLERKSSKEWTVGIAFGPGLSVEGILLRSKGV
jgi:predicted naringenin-chalcone synthase